MSDELIKRLTDYQNTIWKYYKILDPAHCGYRTPSTLKETPTYWEGMEKQHFFVEWLTEVEPLYHEVQEIYSKLKSDLGLPYDRTSLGWSIKDVKDKEGEDVKDKLLKIIEGIKELKSQETWKLEKEILINPGKETPGAGGEATETPGAWGKVEEFVKKHWQWLITTILQIFASIRR